MQKQSIKDYFEEWGHKLVGFFAIPFLIAFITYHYFSNEWAIIGSVFYFGLLIILFFVRCIFRLFFRKIKTQERTIKKNAELFYAMHSVYEILKEGTISPKYFREKLYETKKSGAIWPSPVFMIVDHAVKKNLVIWNSPESWKYESNT